MTLRNDHMTSRDITQCYTMGGRPYLVVEEECPLATVSLSDASGFIASALLLRVPSVTVPWDPLTTGRPSDVKVLRLSIPLCREVSTYFGFISAPIGCSRFFVSLGLERENKQIINSQTNKQTML